MSKSYCSFLKSLQIPIAFWRVFKFFTMALKCLMVWLLPSSQSSGSYRHIRHFINSERSRVYHASCTTVSYSCWSGLHTFPIQLKGECCFFAYFFFLHSTSNLTYCLRKRTLGVNASWLGSHEHSVIHEIWVVGLIKTTTNYLFTYSWFFQDRV